MNKKVLTIILTALMFLSGVVLGIATVFRVNDVSVVATVVSEQAKAEAEAFKKDLLKVYNEENIFSVKNSEMDSVLSEYPYLRVTDFKKSYPNKIVVSISEDAEVYAVETGEEYYILGGSGSVLGRRASSLNRLDNAENVRLKGLTVTGEKGGELSGDECWPSMLGLCKAMDETLGGIRANVVSVEVLTRTPETFYLITMREGVKVYVHAPSVMTEEKAREAMNEYLSLSDAERMTGRITVRDAGGKVYVSYSPLNEFQPE